VLISKTRGKTLYFDHKTIRKLGVQADCSGSIYPSVLDNVRASLFRACSSSESKLWNESGDMFNRIKPGLIAMVQNNLTGLIPHLVVLERVINNGRQILIDTSLEGDIDQLLTLLIEMKRSANTGLFNFDKEPIEVAKLLMKTCKSVEVSQKHRITMLADEPIRDQKGKPIYKSWHTHSHRYIMSKIVLDNETLPIRI